MYKIQL